MSQTTTGFATPNLLLPGGCSYPGFVLAHASVRTAGREPSRCNPSAREVRERCQLLLPWPTLPLLRAAPFQPALVFMGLSHETCSSVKCQKTILLKNWLNSSPFKAC